MPWDTIIGQERAKRTLRTALAGGRMPHAWLFTGIEGVGKDAAAIAVATYLRCERPGPDATPCGVCHGCTSTASLQNANVRFVFALPSGKSEDTRSDAPMLKLSDAEISQIQDQIARKATDPYHNISIPRAQQIKISSVREVRRDISMSATETGWRVIIVSEAHQMGNEAANAFLKTLEEPASRVVLILTSSSRERLLPTILSRCQEVRFESLNESEIAEALVERHKSDRTSAALLAKLSGGSYSRAVEMMSGDLAQVRFDVITFLRAALKRSPIAVHAEVERLTAAPDRPRLEQTLALLQLWLRDAIALRVGASEDFVVNRDQIEDLQSFNRKFGGASVPQLILLVEDSIRAIRSNAQIPLVFIVLAMRLAEVCYRPS
ncbi:MAG TPA: DNA polymerase III subunit delta' [Candidatus Kapabacteria bacterium]|nr:DNA polymerase III subunit delta' [Candidatus Kapabacteria bacterium]